MRITCETIGDFLQNIGDGDPHRKTIHFNRSRKDMNSDGSSQEVYLQMSAVLRYEDTTEALVECGFNCGIDRGEDDVKAGTKLQTELTQMMEEYCEANGLRLRPGVLDF